MILEIEQIETILNSISDYKLIGYKLEIKETGIGKEYIEATIYKFDNNYLNMYARMGGDTEANLNYISQTVYKQARRKGTLKDKLEKEVTANEVFRHFLIGEMNIKLSRDDRF